MVLKQLAERRNSEIRIIKFCTFELPCGLVPPKRLFHRWAKVRGAEHLDGHVASTGCLRCVDVCRLVALSGVVGTLKPMPAVCVDSVHQLLSILRVKLWDLKWA